MVFRKRKSGFEDDRTDIKRKHFLNEEMTSMDEGQSMDEGNTSTRRRILIYSFGFWRFDQDNAKPRGGSRNVYMRRVFLS